MSDIQTYRCYYDDGTVLVSSDCPEINDGSPLINTEYQIIQNVIDSNPFPWFLIILALVYTFTDQRR